ncbi:type I polyketide synthase, partial [Candidatus Cyanaurora vandensis]|uniref:type I polyketide synthase n=1 Tax=Candidatus Cyanaurora vandensis TaxID=2714958 RepID=UPI00257C2952
MSSFTCLSLSPLGLAHPGIAVATIRAGGVGLLDREFCDNDALAQDNLTKLLQLVVGSDRAGLRLRADQIATSQELLALLNQPHWLVLSSWEPATLAEVLASLPVVAGRKLLLEVTDITQAVALDGFAIDGLIAKGHESAGWVGEDPALILVQRLLAQVEFPVYVQGGVGIHTAAACRAAGAMGVVLDDQLLLMPESPLPESWQKYLLNLSGQEAGVIGERLPVACRVLIRPGFAAVTELQQLADRADLAGDTSAEAMAQWQAAAKPLIGWGEPGVVAWPVGQGVGLATGFKERFATINRLVQELVKQSAEHIRLSQEFGPLEPGAPLAVSHGTRYPIVQGPMTRVSDRAEFAFAVAEAGGLPMLALALMRGPQVKELLEKTKQLMGNRSWGIGILGFVPHALREEQTAIVKQIRPPFALIAGGRPDQAAKFEQDGIATYIHVPAPKLLEMFLEQGARKFVFEGRECGGHVGPLSSFVLWETMVDTLLSKTPKGSEAEIHALFAGGIHDARSAAMVSAMAAPLTQRGMKVGVLVGTAYLFTAESVSCGAIVKGYQDEALRCERTINLETGPGHASRCAVTPFAQEFYGTRRQMLTAGRPHEEVRDTLEGLTLGRLRVASKGMVRNAEGKVITVPEDEQLRDGMYMIGQVATLRDQVCTVASLHQEISEDSAQWLARVDAEAELPGGIPLVPADVAIIGMASLFPRAHTAETFWDNILRKVNVITEIPPERWDWRLYFDPERSAKDKIYSRWGGFLEEIPFDPMRFGIPPKSMRSIDFVQMLTLEATGQALEHAGYGSGNFDKENTSVIIGSGSGGGDLGIQYAVRTMIPQYVPEPGPEIMDRMPEWTEETFAGSLLNVCAGRVANRFDFGGSNYVVDAACASSMASVALAVQELQYGRCNLAVAGGMDTGMSAFGFMSFCKTHALSPQGKSRAFDKKSDGIVISEGVAMLVLKRLADAERDGDTIYAVIKAVGSSSDGRALGLTAPRSIGQIRALKRAYRQAGFGPETLGFYEAHGTGTVAGDRAELETVITCLTDVKTPAKNCAMGSIKTMLGHAKGSAGIASLLKVAMAIHHKVQPAHMNVDDPHDPIVDPKGPVYLLKEARPWFDHPDHPRRACGSAFGFGGTNFHLVMEEYQGSLKDTRAPGADPWPCELFVWRGDQATITKEVRKLLEDLANKAEPRMRDLAYSLARRALDRRAPKACLTIVADGLIELQEGLTQALDQLEGRGKTLPAHVQLTLDLAQSPSVAFLFPGQGAQYPDMGREPALFLNELRGAVEAADRVLNGCFEQQLSQFIYPPSPYSEAVEEQNRARLTDTHIAQPAIGTVATGYLDLLTRLGVKAERLAGHSYGEYAALHAAGVFSRTDFLRLSETRGRVMAGTGLDGAMAAVLAPRDTVLGRLQTLDGVTVANHNAPQQTVISGTKEAIQKAVQHLTAAGLTATMLPVAGAFHSALMESAQAPLAEAIRAIEFQSPQVPVYANTTGRPYNPDPQAIQEQLSGHLLHSVEFVSQIKAMYEDGTRVFIEVGPRNILTKLVSQILADSPHTAVALDGPKGLRSLLISLGTLLAQGVEVQLPLIFKDRAVKLLDLNRLVEQTRKPELPATVWMVSGGTARPKNSTISHAGKSPTLTVEAVAEAKAKDKAKAALPPAPRPVVAAVPVPIAPPIAPVTIAPARQVVPPAPAPIPAAP